MLVGASAYFAILFSMQGGSCPRDATGWALMILLAGAMAKPLFGVLWLLMAAVIAWYAKLFVSLLRACVVGCAALLIFVASGPLHALMTTGDALSQACKGTY